MPNIIHNSNCIFQNEKKIYYFAVTEGTTYSVSNKIYEATIFSDGKISKFTQTNLVFPVTGINACSMIVYKNKVFTFGGTGAGLINKIFCIDIDSNGNLTKITEINSFISLYATTSIVIGNFLYIIGGSSANGTRDSNIYKATLTVGWGLYSDSVYNNSPELYKYTTNLNLFNSNPLLPTMVGLGGKVSSIITNGIENQLTTNITYSIDSKYNIKQSYNDILNIDSRDFSQKISNFHLGDSLIKIGETKVYY